jgi:hypothetical protein
MPAAHIELEGLREHLRACNLPVTGSRQSDACCVCNHCVDLQVTQVTEVPGGLLPAVHMEGLQEPLSLTLRQHLDVMQLKVR